jgi:phosphohistidine phosphatase
MQVLIIRHAPTEDREVFALSGQSDDLRPLSELGKAKMRRNIQGIQKIVPKLQAIASSPLLRAQQTADLLARAYSPVQRDTLPALAPLGAVADILSYLQDYANTSHIIALVGHEPDLAQLATWLLTGHADNWLPLKKGAACLLEFPDEVEAGQAELEWALTPGQLRGLVE